MNDAEHQRLKNNLASSWFFAATVSLFGSGVMSFNLYMNADARHKIDHQDIFIAEKIKQYTSVCNPHADIKKLQQNPQRDTSCEMKWAQSQLQQAKLSLQSSGPLKKTIGGLSGLALLTAAGTIVYDRRKLKAFEAEPK